MVNVSMATSSICKTRSCPLLRIFAQDNALFIPIVPNVLLKPFVCSMMSWIFNVIDLDEFASWVNFIPILPRMTYCFLF